jgi:predicted DNA-binding protein
MGKRTVSDLDLLDMNADELGEFVDELTPQPTTPEEQAELLAQVPPADPNAPVMVVTSLRLSSELKHRIDAAAEEDGVNPSTYIRKVLESSLAGRNRSNLVNVEDAIRALRSVPRAA